MFSLRGLKSERGQGSLRDPFRSALEPAQEKRGDGTTKKICFETLDEWTSLVYSSRLPEKRHQKLFDNRN